MNTEEYASNQQPADQLKAALCTLFAMYCILIVGKTTEIGS